MRFNTPLPLSVSCALLLLVISSSTGAQPPRAASSDEDDSILTPPVALQAGYCDVDAGRLYYEVFGEGPAIVLIHDGLLHSEVWDNQIGPLSARYKVIRYDRRGYGRSDAPTQPFSNVDDLHALLAHLDVPRAVLIGSSAGGGLAIDYTLQHRDMVNGLVLCGAVVNGLGYSSHFIFRAYGNFGPDMETTLQRWIDDPYSVAPGNDEARARVGELLRANPQSLDFSKARLEQRPPFSAVTRLPEIAVPTLIITGEKDIPDVLAHAGAIEAGIAGSSRIVLKDAGHLCYLEQPEAFNAAMLDFLSLLPLHLRAELEAAQGGEAARTPLETGFAEVNGTRLYYEMKGEGPPLVMIHGGLVDRRMWDEQFETFARQCKVIRYDARGYGLSDGPPGPYHDEEDLRRLLSHLGIDKSHIMGLSMGGRIAIDFALEHPEMTASLIAVGPGLSGYQFSSPEFEDYITQFRAASESGDLSQTVECALRAWTDGPRRPPEEVNPAVREKVRAMSMENMRPGKNLARPQWPDPPAIDRLADIKAPTLALVGDLDMPDIHSIVDLVADGVPGAKKVVIEGAAHMVNMEQPQAFDDAVVEFLSSITPGGLPEPAAAPILDSGYITVNGVTLYCEIMGTGEPLVLVHGFRHDRRTWDGHFQALAEHYRVIRYDLAGHGLSKHPPGTEIGCENLRDLLACLGIEKARFIGHGMGGRICIDFALQYPEMVEKLIVVSSGMAGIQLGAPAVEANNAAMIEALRRGDVETASEYFTRSWTDGPHRPPEEVDPELRNHCLAMVRHAMEPGRAAGIAAVPEPPSVERLGEISAPLLVIVGELDQPTVRQIADMLAEQVQGARKVVIPGAAHMAHMEEPEEFRRIVREFLVGM